MGLPDSPTGRGAVASADGPGRAVAAAVGGAVASCAAAAGARPAGAREGADGAEAAGRGAEGAVSGRAGAGAAVAGLVGVAGVGTDGRGAAMRDGSVTSLAGLLTTRRWPGRASCVIGGASAAGLETAPSETPGAVGVGAGAGGRAPGRASAGVLTATAAPAAALPPAEGAVAACSSGWTARRNPSRSALRRARSACASSIEDEWLLTPIPRSTQRSRASLLVSPSSRASS